MAWNFLPNKPVYTQIAERIILSILSGYYQPGEQIPSVRQLALEAAVNPNTVQHAFTELKNEGIIIFKDTVGRYVTDNTEIIETCRKKMAEQSVKAFAKDIKPLCLDKSQIIKMLEEELT